MMSSWFTSSDKKSPPEINREELKQKFRQCLRDADACIKQRDFTKAKSLLNEAKKYDPTNPYLSAFKERIELFERNPDLIGRDVKSTLDSRTEPSDPFASRIGDRTLLKSREMVERDIRRQVEMEYKAKFTQELLKAEQKAAVDLEDFNRKKEEYIKELEAEIKKKYENQLVVERKKVQEEIETAIENERKKIQAQYEMQIKEQNETIRKIRSQLQKEMEQSLLRRLEEVSKQYDHKMELLGTKMPKTREEALDLYREKIYEYYSKGEPSVDDAKRLMELKEILELTFDDHFTLESEVWLNIYMEKIERMLLSGEITLENKDKLDSLIKQFNVSPEQEQQLRAFVESKSKQLSRKAHILIVDDDEPLLFLLRDALVERSFQVTLATNIESALKKIESDDFDVILADIKFPEGELDGFKLFSKVQENPQLRKIPFIFMSALTDGVIMRSGVQLGVDDYITKPLDIDFLVAVIEGKLKRYKSLYYN